MAATTKIYNNNVVVVVVVVVLCVITLFAAGSISIGVLTTEIINNSRLIISIIYK